MELKQTRICRDSYGTENPAGAETQFVPDAVCDCEREAAESQCTDDGTAQVTYGAWNHDYCTGDPTETVEDEKCLCGYTDWSNAGCVRDGYMKQTRTQTTEYGYCTILEQTVGDASCSGGDPANPKCGDGVVEGDEVCDGGFQSCSVGLYKGTQACDSQCSGWDTCQATESCGDGIVNGGEECDGSENCNSDCTRKNDPSGPECGNGIKETGEDCDAGKSNGIVCEAAYGQTCEYCSAACVTLSVSGTYCGTLS